METLTNVEILIACFAGILSSVSVCFFVMHKIKVVLDLHKDGECEFVKDLKEKHGEYFSKDNSRITEVEKKVAVLEATVSSMSKDTSEIKKTVDKILILLVEMGAKGRE